MKKYPSEMYAYTDPVTGASVKRLTSYRGNSNHLYFTNNCFYDNGKKIVLRATAIMRRIFSPLILNRAR